MSWLTLAKWEWFKLRGRRIIWVRRSMCALATN